MNKSELFWQTYLNLENELLKVSNYIYFTDSSCKGRSCHHLEAYSPLIADLILRCGSEIEAISKELFYANGGIFSGDKSEFYYDTVCLRYLNKIFKFDAKLVLIVSPSFEFNDSANTILKPLHKADQRSGTYWSRCYQAVKHDKYNSLNCGNVKALILSLAALFLLNIYLKNISFKIRYNDYSKVDMSFGSKVFAIPKPLETFIMGVINNEDLPEILQSVDSPYIFKYTQETYKIIKQSNKESREKINKIVFSQPEMNDRKFTIELSKQLINEKNFNAFTIMSYIFKYRINMEMPSSLPFEQRKEIFLKSHWHQFVLLNEEITPDNIQDQIDMAATFSGQIEIANIEYQRIQKGLNDANCEMVIDNGNIKY